MTRPLTLCTQTDVEEAASGLQELTKLLDERKTGQPWPFLVNSAIKWATTQFLMAYGVQNEIGALQPPYDPSIVQIVARLSLVEAWRIGTKGAAMPPELDNLDKKLQTMLEQMTNRKRNPAQDPEAPNQHVITSIDPDPDGVKFTRYSLAHAGFG